MPGKSEKIAALIEQFRGQNHDPHYLAYFDLFNRGLFYEAHDVLEILWLPQRKAPKGDFYKGLIQLAGAFVHLQKNRLKPAAALLKLTRTNLKKFGDSYEELGLSAVHQLTNRYLDVLVSSDYETNPLASVGPPRIHFHISHAAS
jgi:predicted metal-dependent hydrolase